MSDHKSIGSFGGISGESSQIPFELQSINVPFQLQSTSSEQSFSKGQNVYDSVSQPSQHSTSGTFLENFFSRLAQFSFERAKEMVDQERDSFIKAQQPAMSSSAIKSSPIIGRKYNYNLNFIIALGNIALAEKNYLNLAFLAPKGFLRKENNTKLEFELVRQEFKKFDDPSLAGLNSEIGIYLGLRQEMIDFYEKLAMFGTAKNIEIADLITDIDLIYEKFQEEKNNLADRQTSNLVPLFNIISWECEILINLLKAYATMLTWDFLSSLISIQEAHRKLTEWSNHLQLGEAAKKSTSFLKAAPSPPTLYLWIWRLKAVLLSKFSLIFYDVLAKNSNSAFDIRQNIPKLFKDYYTRIVTFCKRTDANAFCLIYDARGSKFQSNGYQHPARVVEEPTGIDSFPAIFSFPSKPSNHWPNVIMLLTERMENPNSYFVGFYDNYVQSTYFIHRYDTNMFILCIYETKKSEKDGNICKFISELSIELKCTKIFASLKSGLK